MLLPWTLPLVNLRSVDHSDGKPPTTVLSADAGEGAPVGQVTRHWPSVVGNPTTFLFRDVNRQLLLRLSRPHSGADVRAYGWSVYDADHLLLARVRHRSRFFGEKMTLHVNGPEEADSVLAELRVRSLPGPWQLAVATGEFVPILPIAGANRPSRERSVDLQAIPEPQRLSAFCGALVALLVYTVGISPPLGKPEHDGFWSQLDI